ncbi:MAG TPA: hypothetical protein VMX13_03605 [Sedimentisphaerales bacterium]|nr:hypothetical protein [Sedimentisphaerales bacterium]
MGRITFYPLGNADSCLIEFADERLMVNDYYRPESLDEGDKRVDLSEVLDEVLKDKGRDYFDAVAFSHRDQDHVGGAEKYFKMEHAPKNENYGTVEMRELWVPAYFIIEGSLECESARVIQKEARHRLREGARIKVFGRSEELTKWIDDEIGENRDGLIVGAGECVNEFITKSNGGAEIFVHSPFSAETDDENSNPNDAGVVLHITFFEDDTETKVIFGSDVKSKIWDKLIEITESHGNERRLEWDIFKISHHCSYTALNQDDKGRTKTEPTENIKRMFEKGDGKSYLVSSSWPIDDESEPPHKQAANYYDGLDGELLVTMEQPNRRSPKPIVFEISNLGHRKLLLGASAAVSTIASRPSSKQG